MRGGPIPGPAQPRTMVPGRPGPPPGDLSGDMQGRAIPPGPVFQRSPMPLDPWADFTKGGAAVGSPLPIPGPESRGPVPIPGPAPQAPGGGGTFPRRPRPGPPRLPRVYEAGGADDPMVAAGLPPRQPGETMYPKAPIEEPSAIYSPGEPGPSNPAYNNTGVTGEGAKYPGLMEWAGRTGTKLGGQSRRSTLSGLSRWGGGSRGILAPEKYGGRSDPRFRY